MAISALFIMLVTIAVLIACSAFFSIAETSFIGLSKIKLRYLLNQKKKNAQLVQNIINQMDKLIATILVGNNFVNIAISSIGTALFISFWGNNLLSVSCASFAVTVMVLIFAEITPKIFAVKRAERVALSIAWFLVILIKVMEPLVKIFVGISNFILKIFGEKAPKRSPLVTVEEIRLMIELGKEEGVLTDGERSMLHRIFEFGTTLAYQVMVPFSNIISIDINSSEEIWLDLLIEEGHSRIPVYEGDTHNIIGIIYARELLNVWRNKDLVVLRDLLHKPHFVNQKKRVSELLREFQKSGIHMAIVTDDNNAIIGLVTLEDLLEEIVGEIRESKLIK